MKSKIIILQRVCPSYKVETFFHFQEKFENCLLIIGDDIPNSKVKNSKDLTKINHTRLRTKHINFFGRNLTFHKGLLKKLILEKPRIIICEAESHFFGYLISLIYKFFYNRNVKLAYWSLVSMPGKDYSKNGFKELVKYFLRNFFNHFFVYHSFGKSELIKKGINESLITIVHNVGNTEFFKRLSRKKVEKIKAKKNLNLDNSLTLLYLGSLDQNKKPIKLLDIYKKYPGSLNLIFLGEGELIHELKQLSFPKKNILIPGFIKNGIENYLSACDIMVVPGRGGVNISESLAFGIPVIVHQADGIEYDLIQDYNNGIIVKEGSPDSFIEAIKFLSIQKVHKTKINFSSQTMAESLSLGCKKMLGYEL